MARITYRNPVLPGFYPDPSVCRVGEEYYLVNSSFEFFPGVPIHLSRDLVNWRTIGHCLTHEAQLPLEKARISGGIFAPTIRYHDGVFYMVTTNTSHGGNFYVTTDNPAGEWSDPIWVDQGGIDPSFFFDDDGRVYLASTGPGGIIQSEIDIATGAILRKPETIWGGTGGRFPEGPHLYKIEGVYYLLVAEGGTEWMHMVTLAKGNSPFGPFESCPHNPIFSHRSLPSPIQGTGHADLVQAHDGSWWMFFLGFRPHRNWHHLGRETFLAPVHWEDGWPVVGDHGQVGVKVEAEGLAQEPLPPVPERDCFTEDHLAPYWNFKRNPDPATWSLGPEGQGGLVLRGNAVNLDELDSPAWIGRRQQHMHCLAKTRLQFEPGRDSDEAGLTIHMTEEHHFDLYATSRGGARVVEARLRIGPLMQVVGSAVPDVGPMDLSIEADPAHYRLIYSPSGREPVVLAEAETKFVSTEVASGFTGVYIAMYATGNGSPCSAPAMFEWFEYRETEPKTAE